MRMPRRPAWSWSRRSRCTGLPGVSSSASAPSTVDSPESWTGSLIRDWPCTKAALDCCIMPAHPRGMREVPMLQGRPVAVLGGVRTPFCRQNTAYADVGNLGMPVRTLGALVEKFGLHGQQLGEVAMGAVIKHPSDWNLGREAALSSGLSPLTPGITLQRACGTSLDAIVLVAGKIATGQIEAGVGGGS